MRKPPKTPNGLHLSANLVLPVESVVETFAILGKRGSGKTSAAVVMAEEMIGAGHPVVIVDPVGVWWGLRSSSDGKGEGLPVVIFGGDHADVPLSEKAGQVVADAVIEGRFPAILDLSHLSKSAMRRFMTDFAERLYHRNREALHLIVDEADLLAPQRLPADGLRLFGAMDDIQRRGRARGIGTTLITQRPAVINKDLLSQSEVLIALRLTGVRDVAAIDEWVRLNADEDQAKTVKGSLASLPVGTAWVWSPSLLDVLEKVAIRHRHTFDSSATPKPGQPRPVAEAFASVDIAALGAQISALTEEAAAADPKVLRARLARVEKELESERTRRLAAQEAPGAQVVEKVVEVPVPLLTPNQERLVAEATERVREYAANACDRAEFALAQTREQVAALAEMLATLQTPAPTAPRPAPERKRPAPTSATPRQSHPLPRAESTAPSGEGNLPKAQRLVLTALAQQGTRTAVQVALLTSYSHKSGGFRNALSSLRSAGLIEGSGTSGMNITQAGLDALGHFEPLPTGDDLLEWWKTNHLGKAERAIVEVLRENAPSPVTVAEIAERTGYSAASGGFRNALSRLRSLQVAYNATPGVLALSDQFTDGSTSR